MNKDKQDEAQRHASRDTIIRAVFHQLVYQENYPYERAYVFIGWSWGLGKTKINQIVNAMKKNFLTRPSEPVSTTYVPLTGGSMCTY